MQISIHPVNTAEEIQLTAQLAFEIWNQHFVPIIGQQQVDYMLAHFQSTEAMTQQIANGMRYRIVCCDGKPVGYCAYQLEAERTFLSKLYIKQAYRGQGLSTALLQEVIRDSVGKRAVYLTVNRHNDQTIAIYRHIGFSVVEEKVKDIGDGFVMDDYIMEKPL